MLLRLSLLQISLPSRFNLSLLHLRSKGCATTLMFGYNTGICGQGSKEYVRFFIDWDNTNNWQDVGMVSFTVYNIIDAKPLKYTVTLMLDAKNVPCSIEKLPRVRVILSCKSYVQSLLYIWE